MTTTVRPLTSLESPAATFHRDAGGAGAPAIRKILLTDYWSFVLVLLNAAALVTVAGIPALLLLVPLLARRVRGIRRTFATGETATGVIVRKRFLRGEWALAYGFQAGESIVQARNYVLGFKLPVKKRDVVTVVYDPEKPSRAFLPVLYMPALERR